MGTVRALRRWITRFRAQRWSKEALLAVILTLAAAAFIAAALVGRDVSSDDKSPVAKVHTPQK
jgi:hypothetical protein